MYGIAVEHKATRKGSQTKKPRAPRCCERPAVGKKRRRSLTAADALVFSARQVAVPYAVQAAVQPAAVADGAVQPAAVAVAVQPAAVAEAAVPHCDYAPAQLGRAALAEAG